MTFLSTDPKFSDSDNVLLGKILQHLRDNPGGGGSGSQTPWASAINGGGFNLSNVATITATSVVSALTGNASTATVLQTARTINGVSFNGSADITLPAGNQTPWASNIDGGAFDLGNVTSIVATEVAANNVVVLDAGGGLGVQFQFAGATFSILDALLDPKLAYNGATWDFVGIVESDSMQVNGVIQATNRLTITQGNANTAVFASTGYSLTGSSATSLIDLAGTWNTSGTPTAIKLNITNTASGSALLSDFQIGGVSQFKVDKSGNATAAGFFLNSGVIAWSGGVGVAAAATIGFSSTSNPSLSPDTVLARDAANTLALRNSTNAQRFRLYNTFTTVDTSGEWLKIDWQTTANQCRIGAVRGTSAGTARVLSIDYGALNASPTAAITIPITSGAIVFGGGITIAGALAGVTSITATGTASFGQFTQTTPVALSALPAASTAGNGARAYITDAVSQVFGATVTGGGSVPSPVYSDGTVWRTG